MKTLNIGLIIISLCWSATASDFNLTNSAFMFAGAKFELISRYSILMRGEQGKPENDEVSLYDEHDAGGHLYFLNIDNKKKALTEIWSGISLNRFVFLGSEKTFDRYLGWVDIHFLCLNTIPSILPFGRSVNGFASGFPSYWQADSFIDLSEYEGWQKQFMYESNSCNVTATSVVLEAGNMILTATNAAGVHFKFVKTGNQWRIFDDAGEVQRVKTNSLDFGIMDFDRAYVKGSATLSIKNPEGKSRNVDASFVMRGYKLKSTRNNYGLYQLVESTNNEVALSRPIWAALSGGRSGNNFSIVKNDAGGGYWLSFLDCRSRLCLSAVSGVMPDGGNVSDPTVGPLSQPKDDPFIRGGVDHIIDLRQFADGDRFFKGGGGVASANQENKVLTLTVTNAAGSKFTFSNPDGQWHAYSFWGEINRIKK